MEKKNNNRTFYLTQAAMIAALYVVLTLIANGMGLANMAIQVRFSEALTILPVLTPAAVPGLFVGCLISNLLIGAMPLDIIFGSLATLAGAMGTYKLRRHKGIAWIPPVATNVLVVPLLLTYGYQIPGGLIYFGLTVGAGQIISCGVLGMCLLFVLKKYRSGIFSL